MSFRLSALRRFGRSKSDQDEEEEAEAASTNFTLVQHVDYDSRRLRSSEARWESEHHGKRTGFHGILDAFVDSAWWEALVSMCVLADLTLTILSFVMDEEDAESNAVFLMSAVFLTVLVFDVLLRIAKDKIHFFCCPFKILNWIELIVGFGGGLMLVLDGMRRACSGDGCDTGKQNKGASLGRSIRPLLRVSRVLRAAVNLFASRGGIHKKIDKATDKITDRLVRETIGDMLILPDENITLKPSQGMFHLEKAQVRTEAFKGLHLPFTILGGIIDLFHMEVDLFSNMPKLRKRERERDDDAGHRLLCVIENVLLVVGPGHHQEPPLPPWDFEAVQEAKSKLIELLLSRFQQNAKTQAETADEAAPEETPAPRKRQSVMKGAFKAPSVRQTTNKAKEAVKRKLQLVIGEVLAHGMHVSIKHVEIRFEDAEGSLSGAPLIGGLKVCTGQIRAQGALEEEDPDDYHEEDFRVRGKWIPSIASGAGIYQSESNVTTTSSNPSIGAKRSILFGQDGSMKAKRHLSHGVRMAMEMHNIAVFWDLHQALPHDDSRLFAPKLREGNGADLKAFLQDRLRNDCRERLRLAVCSQVEKAWVKTQGKSALERLRRLRERVAAHRYLIMPAGCSVHASVKPPPDGSRPPKVVGQDYWPVATDVDVHIPAMPCSVDLNQAQSLVRLLDYVKRWNREDNRIMWQPPPHHMGSQVAFARWGYALRQVLHGIDDSYPWHSLSWMEMRRRAKINSEYLQALCEKQPDMEKIAVLQVALPLAEVLLARQAAIAVSQEQSRKGKMAGFKARVSGTFSKARTLSRSLSKEVDEEQEEVMVRVQSAKEIIEHEEHVVKDGIRDLEKEALADSKPPAFKASQIYVRVDLMEALLLRRAPLSSREPRRQLLRCEARGISCAGVRCAPRKIWMHIAPPAALEECLYREETPEDPVCEVTVKDMRVVLCSAPSSAPRLRRLMSFTRIPDDEQPQGEQASAGSTGSFLIREETAARSNASAVQSNASNKQGRAADALRDAGASADLKRVVSIDNQPEYAVLEDAGMTVLIKGANGLRNADLTPRYDDPYCVIMLKGKSSTKWSTGPRKHGINPVWYQSKRMPAPGPDDELEFAVWDRDTTNNADDLLGEAYLKSHLFFPDGFEGRVLLTQKNGNKAGKLEIKITVDGQASGLDNLKPVMQVRGTCLKPAPSQTKAKPFAALSDKTRWICAIWTMPVEVYMLKPFFKQLATHFKAPETLNRNRPFLRRSDSHLPMGGFTQVWTKEAEDVADFWMTLDKKRKVHAETVILREKKQRKNEKMMGLMGPMAGKRIEGEVLFRGGMHGTQLMEYSKAKWLARTAILPTGILKGTRSNEMQGTKGMRMGYHPLAMAENGNGNEDRSRSGNPGSFKGSNGWWYATEEEAIMASEVLNTGCLPSTPKQDRGDISCAGVDAYEEKEPLFSLPRTALSTWMPTYDKLNSNFSYRYKPHTSARGLLQLPHNVSRRHDRSVCPAPLVECCGCSSTEYIKPVAQISSNCGEACERAGGCDHPLAANQPPRQVHAPSASQVSMVEVQQRGVLTPTQEAQSQEPAFGGGSQAVPSLPSTAFPSAERAGRADTGANILLSPTPPVGMDLASSIAGEYKVVSAVEIGLPAPAKLKELWEAMGVSDAVGVG